MKGIIRDLNCQTISITMRVICQRFLKFRPAAGELFDKIGPVVNKGHPRSYRQPEPQAVLAAHLPAVIGNRREEVVDVVAKLRNQIVQGKEMWPEYVLKFVVVAEYIILRVAAGSI